MKIKNTKCVFTIATGNFINQAIALGNSLLTNEKNCDFIVIIIDENASKFHFESFITIDACSLYSDNWLQFAFQYSATQISTALKPAGIRYLINQGYEKVIFLDSDIMLFSEMTNIWSKLENHSLVLTPHYFIPPELDGNIPTHLDIRISGIFNSGVIGANKHSLNFMEWWFDKLKDNCIFEPMIGIFNEQSWLNEAVVMVEDLCILRDKCYNVAIWNLHERKLDQNNRIDGKKLVSFHFCKHRHVLDWEVRFLKNESDQVFNLYKQYNNILNDIDFPIKTEYSYGCFNDGESISEDFREAFRRGLPDLVSYNNPFLISKNDRKEIQEKISSLPIGYTFKNNIEVNKWENTYLSTTYTLSKTKKLLYKLESRLSELYKYECISKYFLFFKNKIFRFMA